MKLYAYWRSSTSYRIRIALNLKGLDYDVVPVDLAAGEHRDKPFSDLNPFMSLPVLEFDGDRYNQSAAILDLLDQRFPDPPLLPQDQSTRARVLELAYAVATDVHAVNNLRVMHYLKDKFSASQDDWVTWYLHWIAATYAPIETRLREMGVDNDWPFGAPGMFEVMLVPQTYNALRFNMDLSPYPRIMALYQKCCEHDAFQRAAPEAQPDAPSA